jgi:hypothetical protein
MKDLPWYFLHLDASIFLPEQAQASMVIIHFSHSVCFLLNSCDNRQHFYGYCASNNGAIRLQKTVKNRFNWVF